jgi:methionine transaminase
MALQSKLPRVGTSIFTVMSRLAEDEGALNLGQGFPDFDPPPELREALCRHTNSGRNQYAPMAGVPALREQIAVKIKRDYARQVDADSEITIVSGATEGIFAVIAAVVGQDDQVILFDPCYDSYAPAVSLQGGRCIHIPLCEPGFGIDFDRLRSAINSRTRLVIINFPNNPTGAVLKYADLETLATILRDTDILLMSDEVYEHIVFDGYTHQSVLRHAELMERSFVVGSFGKAYHSTGWKVGWVVAPSAMTTEVRKVHQFLTFSTSTPAQWALADVLQQAPAHLTTLASFYQSKRDTFRSLLDGSGLRLLDVAGTYFQLVDYGHISLESDVTFAQRLTVEAKVAVIPISTFYQVAPRQHLVRLCFAKSEAVLRDAAHRLTVYLRTLTR